jgi:hypothetical protein
MIVSSDMFTGALVCEYLVHELAFTSSQHRHNGHYTVNILTIASAGN